MKKHILWLLPILALTGLALSVLVGASGIGLADWRSEMGRAILSLRVNRAITGFVVGAGLSGAGVVLQALLRNPLAEPYVLGVSGGAALGAALAILSGLSAVVIWALPLSAFVAGIATLAVVSLLAYRGGQPSIYGVLLSGIVVNAICTSLLMLLISMAPVADLHSITWWMLGNLQGTSWYLLAVSAVLSGLACLGIVALARALNALTLGRDMAHHLGVRTGLVVSVALALATLLTAIAVSLAGVIGFVGLIVPHLMRSLVGPDHQRLVPASLLAGGLFLVLCDTLARTVLGPVEIPVGVVTALIGGPFFLFLLRRRRRQGWLE